MVQNSLQRGRGTDLRLWTQMERSTKKRKNKKVMAIQFPKAQQKEVMYNGKQGLVLLVEDNEMVRDVINLFLEQLGYQVVSATDGLEAQEVFRTRHNDICLVFSDVIMPRMDGFQTMAALREIRPDIPIILASGHHEVKDRVAKNGEQPQAVLLKPFTKKELQETLDRVLKDSKVQNKRMA